MEDVAFGLLAIAAGALFCLRGYLAFRLIIPVWAAFVGFTLGAGLAASIADESFLGTGVGWLVGLGGAVLFALLAYSFYEVAVVIAMGSIGFALGASLMVALDVSWTWVIVIVGIALGGLLALAAIAVDLPMMLLIVLTSIAGASAITTGIMLLVGAIDTADFSDSAVTARAEAEWVILELAFALLGVARQVRAAERPSGSTRESWAPGPG